MISTFEEKGLMIASALANFIRYRGKPKNPRKILVIKPDHIGDLILSTPVFRALRRNYPRAEIVALIGEWSASVIELIPEIDRAITYRPREFVRDGRHDPLSRKISLIKSICAERFDLAVDMRPTWLSVAVALAGAFRWRIDRSTHRIIMNLRRACTAWDHEIARNMATLADAGIVCDDDRPYLVVPKHARDEADSILTTLPARNGPLVILHPASPVLIKRWPPESFAKLADRLRFGLDASVALVGAPAEAPIVDLIIEMSTSKPISLVGRTSIASLAGVLSRCDLFIGNDSGPMHIAAALGTKTIGIFGPSSKERFGPYGRCTLIRSDVDCGPCMSDVCRYSEAGCIGKVDVEDVYRCAVELLCSDT